MKPQPRRKHETDEQYQKRIQERVDRRDRREAVRQKRADALQKEMEIENQELSPEHKHQLDELVENTLNKIQNELYPGKPFKHGEGLHKKTQIGMFIEYFESWIAGTYACERNLCKRTKTGAILGYSGYGDPEHLWTSCLFMFARRLNPSTPQDLEEFESEPVEELFQMVLNSETAQLVCRKAIFIIRTWMHDNPSSDYQEPKPWVRTKKQVEPVNAEYLMEEFKRLVSINQILAEQRKNYLQGRKISYGNEDEEQAVINQSVRRMDRLIQHQQDQLRGLDPKALKYYQDGTKQQ